MRKFIPVVLLVLAGSWVVAQEPKGEPPGQATEVKGKKEMTAIVVSTDPTVKTITVRREKSAPESQPETLAVAGAALAHLVSVKTGEKVKLVLTTDPATNKESVTSFECRRQQTTSALVQHPLGPGTGPLSSAVAATCQDTLGARGTTTRTSVPRPGSLRTPISPP